MTSAPQAIPGIAAGMHLGGKYLLKRQIGEGATGAVWEASGPAGERVACKILVDRLSDDGGTSTRLRFLREAKIASSLPSDNISAVIDNGLDETTGSPFIVMTYLDGENLAAVLEREGSLDWPVACRIAIQAAKGLMMAHAANVVHRDIKPENLFLHRESAQNVVVKVCDFGIAKSQKPQDVRLTTTGAFLGTPLFMAPEQLVNAKNVDAQADVWGLAMTLYYALSGTPALQHVRSFTDLVSAVSNDLIPPLQSIAPWVPGELAAIVHGALLYDKKRRCPSITEFSEALRPFIDGEETIYVDDLARIDPTITKRPAAVVAVPWSWDTAKAAAKTANEKDPLLGTKLRGKYLLTRLLGRGGMGAVYEADDAGKKVALKIIISDTTKSSDGLRRFLREARATMAIQSEHVVRVEQADTDPDRGVPFIVMEMLRGTDLDRQIKASGALDPAVIARLFVDAAKGIAAAHALGIVHRDIKPANIFLHERLPAEGGGIVSKICDFGVAKQLPVDGDSGVSQADLTQTGGMLGSPMYMSPEQARNAKNVDPRSDIWSLCASLYEALSGHRPWEGASSVGELILALWTRTPLPIQDHAPWILPGLAEVVHHGLKTKLPERWASMEELAAALEPFATKKPITKAMLAPVSPEVRAIIAERVRDSIPPTEPAPNLDVVGARTNEGHTSTLALEKKPTSALTMISIGIVAICAIAIGAKLYLDGHPPPAQPPTIRPVDSVVPITTATGPIVAPTKTMTVKIAVKPKTADVHVAGVAKTLDDDGNLVLDGEAGDRFDVTAEANGQRLDAKVLLGRDGTAEPSSLEVPAAPVTGRPGIGPGPKKTKDPDGPAPPTPTTPKPKDWN